MLLLSRLRMAVKKVRLLLNLSAHRWRIASMMNGGRTPRRLSFNERPGLACAATDDHDDQFSYYSANSEDSGSNRGQLQRTTSCDPSDQDSDIDQRADMFIANFRRQLQMERQISLEVRYFRGNSFDWRSP